MHQRPTVLCPRALVAIIPGLLRIGDPIREVYPAHMMAARKRCLVAGGGLEPPTCRL